MSRALDVVTLTGEEYDDLMECKEMVTSLLAQLSAAKDRIAELTPVAGMDWRETMQRMLTRMEETDRWPAICDEARARNENDAGYTIAPMAMRLLPVLLAAASHDSIGPNCTADNAGPCRNRTYNQRIKRDMAFGSTMRVPRGTVLGTVSANPQGALASRGAVRRRR